MSSFRRTAVNRLALVAATVGFVAACSDSPLSPGSATRRGSRGLRDEIDTLNMLDTLECKGGWSIIRGVVECTPYQ
jgi:hypothetical protein